LNYFPHKYNSIAVFMRKLVQHVSMDDMLNYHVSMDDMLNYHPHKYSDADVLNYHPHKHSHADVLN